MDGGGRESVVLGNTDGNELGPKYDLMDVQLYRYALRDLTLLCRL